MDRAIRLYEQNLADCELVFGANHVYTLTSRNHLARAYLSTGNLELANPWERKPLAAVRSPLG